jgi:hypothetical protein
VKRTGRKWYAENEAAEDLLKQVDRGAKTLCTRLGQADFCPT